MDFVDVSSDYTKEIIIMATNACNLKCKYCYETNKNAPSMDVERIKVQLGRELKMANMPYTHYIINFHGGEPFLVFDKVRQIVNWVDKTFS